MPIVERDPWRMQYFERVACPDGVFIPTEDGDSYRLFPQQRWIYNKLLVAESQGLRAACTAWRRTASRCSPSRSTTCAAWAPAAGSSARCATTS